MNDLCRGFHPSALRNDWSYLLILISIWANNSGERRVQDRIVIWPHVTPFIFISGLTNPECWRVSAGAQKGGQRFHFNSEGFLDFLGFNQTSCEDASGDLVGQQIEFPETFLSEKQKRETLFLTLGNHVVNVGKVNAWIAITWLQLFILLEFSVPTL